MVLGKRSQVIIKSFFILLTLSSISIILYSNFVHSDENEPSIIKRYTPNSESNCILQNGQYICNALFYPSPVFINEDGQYKKLTEISNITWQNGGFNFSYGVYWVLLEPFVIYNNQYKTIRDIRTAFPNIQLIDYVERLPFNHKFAFNLTNVPSNIIGNVNYIGFRVKDSQGLTLSDLELDRDNQRVIIKDKVEFSYRDLIENHYTLNFVNHSYLLIGNISENYKDGIISIDPTVQLKQTSDFEDAMISKAANTTNYGTGDLEILNEFAWASNAPMRRDLFKFNLTNNLPSGSIISQCDLNLYAYASSTLTKNITASRVLRNWVESQVTWLNYSTGNAWGSPGANSSTDVNDTWQNWTLVPNVVGWYIWNLTGADNLCQKWFDGEIPNYGVFLEMVNMDGDYYTCQFRQSEYTTDLTLRPYVNLTYTYTSPCSGGNCYLDYHYLDSDIYYGEAIFGQSDSGTMMKWYVGDICDTATPDTAKLQLYIGDKFSSPDSDVRIMYIREQTWDESTAYATLDGYTQYNTTNLALSSTTSGTYTNITVSTQLTEACQRGDDYMTIQLEDPDSLVGTWGGRAHTTVTFMGNINEISGNYYSFVSRDGATTSQRPILFVNYTPPTPPTYNEFVDPTPISSYVSGSTINFNMTLNETCGSGVNSLIVEIDGANNTVCSNCPLSPPDDYQYEKTGLSSGNHTVALWCNSKRYDENWIITETGTTNWANATAPADNYHDTDGTFTINCTAYALSGITNISLYGDFGRVKYDYALMNYSSFSGSNSLESINFTNTVLINDSYHYYCASNSSAGNWVQSSNGNKTLTVGKAIVYFVIASDTESLNRESEDGEYQMELSFENYNLSSTSITGMHFNTTWRSGLNDSFNKMPKITWYMMTHEAHGHSVDNNSHINPVGYNVIADIMYGNQSYYSPNYYWKTNVTLFGDSYGWHNHHSYWNGTTETSPNSFWVGAVSSEFFFNGTQLFYSNSYNETDYIRAEKLVSLFAYENGLPWTSFRAGWLQNGLGTSHDNYMNFLSNNTAIDFTELSLSTGNMWEPVRFEDDYNRLNGFRCDAGPVTSLKVDNAFNYSNNGHRTVVCTYGHNYGFGYKSDVESLRAKAQQNASDYGVQYKWVTDLEAAQAWYRITDTTPPNIAISIDGDYVVADFNEELYMPPSLSMLVNNGTTTNYTLHYMTSYNSTRYRYNKSNWQNVAIGYRVRATDKGFNVNTSGFLESSIDLVDPTTSSPMSVQDGDTITIKFKFYAAGTEKTTGVEVQSITVNGTDPCTLSGAESYVTDHWEQDCTLPASGYENTGLQDLTISANHSTTAIITQTEGDALRYSTVYNEGVVNSFTINQALDDSGKFIRKIPDVLTITGLTNRISNFLRFILDSFNLNNLSTRLFQGLKIPIQNLTFFFSLFKFNLFGRTATDNLTINSQTQKQNLFNRLNSEVVDINSGILRNFVGSMSVNEDVNINDATLRNYLASRNGGDSITFGFLMSSQNGFLKRIDVQFQVDSLVSKVTNNQRLSWNSLTLTDRVGLTYYGMRYVFGQLTITSAEAHQSMLSRLVASNFQLTDSLNDFLNVIRKMYQDLNINIQSTQDDNLYLLDIIVPSTSSAESVAVGDNITIQFNFTKFGNPITSNVNVTNITIGGAECSILDGSEETTIQLQDNVTGNLGDTFVDALSADTNYDGYSYLTVVTHASSSQSRIWIRFNLSSIPVDSTVTGFSLALYHYQDPYAGSNPHNISLFKSTNFTWNESIITWNNDPSYTNNPLVNITSDSTVGHWDVWSLQSSEVINSTDLEIGNITFNLGPFAYTSNSGSRFYSELSTNTPLRPYLNVTYTSAGGGGQQLVYNSGTGLWEINCTVPSLTSGLKDLVLYVNYTTDGVNRTATESESINYGGVISKVVTTFLTLNDLSLRQLNLLRTNQDDLSIGTSINRAFSALRNIINNFSFSELVSRLLMTIRHPVQDINFASELIKQFSAQRGILNQISFSDAILRQINFVRIGQDDITFSNILNRLFAGFKYTQEDIALSDLAQRQASFNRLTTTGFNLFEAFNYSYVEFTGSIYNRSVTQGFGIFNEITYYKLNVRLINQDVSISIIQQRTFTFLRGVVNSILMNLIGLGQEVGLVTETPGGGGGSGNTLCYYEEDGNCFVTLLSGDCPENYFETSRECVDYLKVLGKEKPKIVEDIRMYFEFLTGKLSETNKEITKILLWIIFFLVIFSRELKWVLGRRKVKEKW